MKLTLDKVFGLLAPHLCIACGVEGSVLCDSCLETAGEPVVPRCAGCHTLSDGFKTCKSCRSWLEPYAVYVTTSYEGIYEQLIRSLKFDSKRQAAEPIARMMAEILPKTMQDFVLCPLPTAPSRIRERGFDHTKLIAKDLSFYTGIKYTALLGRKSNVRQLGASRSQRLVQMKEEFFAKDVQTIVGKNVLLVDDVVTTGASVSAAAKTLKKAGAKRVIAIVFAQKL
jgi:ComF family protein